MPVVHVYYDPKEARGYSIGLIIDKLPGIIAKSFSVPGVPETQLSPGDISVISHEFRLHDIHTHDIEIQIFLQNYPQRVQKKDELILNAYRACAKIMPKDRTYYILSIFCELAFMSYGGSSFKDNLKK